MPPEEKAIDTGPAEAPAERDNYTQMLAVRHVARLLGVHESTVRMWADSNVLESYRIGPRQDRRIPMASVRRVLEAARNWPHYGPAGRHRQEAAPPRPGP
jgi:excisionase family DNA binding protein